MNKQAGLSLIEFVLIVVIVGVLSATAVPKFVNFKYTVTDTVLDGVVQKQRACNKRMQELFGDDKDYFDFSAADELERKCKARRDKEKREKELQEKLDSLYESGFN